MLGERELLGIVQHLQEQLLRGLNRLDHGADPHRTTTAFTAQRVHSENSHHEFRPGNPRGAVRWLCRSSGGTRRGELSIGNDQRPPTSMRRQNAEVVNEMAFGVRNNRRDTA